MSEITIPPANWLRRQCPNCGLWVTGLVETGETVAAHGCKKSDPASKTDQATLAMILSAYDQIVIDRRCDRERTCMGSSAGFRVHYCQCYRDAMNRVERGESNAG